MEQRSPNGNNRERGPHGSDRNQRTPDQNTVQDVRRKRNSLNLSRELLSGGSTPRSHSEERSPSVLSDFNGGDDLGAGLGITLGDGSHSFDPVSDESSPTTSEQLTLEERAQHHLGEIQQLSQGFRSFMDSRMPEAVTNPDSQRQRLRDTTENREVRLTTLDRQFQEFMQDLQQYPDNYRINDVGRTTIRAQLQQFRTEYAAMNFAPPEEPGDPLDPNTPDHVPDQVRALLARGDMIREMYRLTLWPRPNNIGDGRPGGGDSPSDNNNNNGGGGPDNDGPPAPDVTTGDSTQIRLTLVNESQEINMVESTLATHRDGQQRT